MTKLGTPIGAGPKVATVSPGLVGAGEPSGLRSAGCSIFWRSPLPVCLAPWPFLLCLPKRPGLFCLGLLVGVPPPVAAGVEPLLVIPPELPPDPPPPPAPPPPPTEGGLIGG